MMTFALALALGVSWADEPTADDLKRLNIRLQALRTSTEQGAWSAGLLGSYAREAVKLAESSGDESWYAEAMAACGLAQSRPAPRDADKCPGAMESARAAGVAAPPAGSTRIERAVARGLAGEPLGCDELAVYERHRDQRVGSYWFRLDLLACHAEQGDQQRAREELGIIKKRVRGSGERREVVGAARKTLRRTIPLADRVEPSPSPPRLVWRGNEVVQNWPMMCGGGSIPEERMQSGFHCMVSDSGPACSQGTSFDVGFDDPEPAGISPSEAVETWNAGQTRMTWCPATEAWPSTAALSMEVQVDESETPTWTEISWDWQPLKGWKHVNHCPWRRVLRVPVVAEVSSADGLVRAAGKAWLIVTGDDPSDWTLETSRSIELDASSAERLQAAGANVSAHHTGYLFFGTGIYNGHRVLHLRITDTNTQEQLFGARASWTWQAP